jgi:hypothetical protein
VEEARAARAAAARTTLAARPRPRWAEDGTGAGFFAGFFALTGLFACDFPRDDAIS